MESATLVTLNLYLFVPVYLFVRVFDSTLLWTDIARIGVAVLLLGGLFVVSARTQAVSVAEQQVRAVELELARDRDQVVAEVNPVSEAIITLDPDGNISLDGAPVDLEGLRLRLPNATSLFVLHVDSQCRFEHVSRVLSVFDEVGIERPTFTVSSQE